MNKRHSSCVIPIASLKAEDVGNLIPHEGREPCRLVDKNRRAKLRVIRI